MVESGLSLHDLKHGMEIFPQKLTSISVSGPKLNIEDGKIGKAIDAAKIKLGKYGRVLVRYSGTEPVIRVMVEGENDRIVDEVNDELCATIRDGKK